MVVNKMMELIIGLVILSFVLSIFLPTISSNFSGNVLSNATGYFNSDGVAITQAEYLIYSNFGVFIALILLIAILAIGGLYKYGKK